MRFTISALKEFPKKFCILFAFIPFYLGMTIIPIISDGLDTLLDYWLIIGLIVLLNNKLKVGLRVTRFKCLCVVYYIVIVVSTVINSGDYMRMIKVISGILMIVELTDYIVEVEYNWFVDLISKVTLVATVLNLVSVIVFPGGFPVYENGSRMYNRYLLGMDNRFCCTLYPGFLFVMLSDIRKHGKIFRKSWIEYSLLLFTYIYTNSVGSLLSAAIILPIILVINTRFAKVIFNGVSYFIVQTAFAFLITFVRFFERMAAFLGFFGKDVTLTSRTYIWNKANKYIESHRWLGCGIEPNEIVKKKFSLVHLHNHILTIIYQTGYIGLVAFLTIVADVYVGLFKKRRNLEAQVIALILFLLFMQLLADSVDNVRNHLFWVMALGANIDVIERKCKITQENGSSALARFKLI